MTDQEKFNTLYKHFDSIKVPRFFDPKLTEFGNNLNECIKYLKSEMKQKAKEIKHGNKKETGSSSEPE